MQNAVQPMVKSYHSSQRKKHDRALQQSRMGSEGSRPNRIIILCNRTTVSDQRLSFGLISQPANMPEIRFSQFPFLTTPASCGAYQTGAWSRVDLMLDRVSKCVP